MSTLGYHNNKFIFHDSRKQVTAKKFFDMCNKPLKETISFTKPLFDTYQELF